MFGAVLDGVAHQLDRGLDRIDPGAAADEFLEDVVLRRAAQLLQVVAAFLRHREVHGDQDSRRPVDGERHGDFVQIDAVEGDFEITQGVHRHADAADFALCQRVIRIQADLRRQVESDVQARLAVGDEVFEALVGLGRIAKAGVLAHGPGLFAVHQAVDAARERVFTGQADHFVAAAFLYVLLGVKRVHLDAGFVEHGFQFGLGALVHVTRSLRCRSRCCGYSPRWPRAWIRWGKCP